MYRTSTFSAATAAYILSLLGALISAPLFASPIYRCVSNGAVHYQQLPCPGAQAGQLSAEKSADPQALRKWLDELKATLPPPRSDAASRASTNRSSSPTINVAALPSRPTSEVALAQCSAEFLRCADSDSNRMDRCIGQIPQCPSGQSQPCCEPAFVVRYQRLRQAGQSRKLAVRDALLAD